MKKTLLIAAVFAAGAAFVSAEGFTFGGNIRSGISVPTEGKTFKTDNWLAGDYFGGGSRVRMNLGWEGDFGGAMIRYQANGSFREDDIWFKDGNIKYAMAYANFLDNKLIVEGGHLYDRFTTTGGYEDGTFGDDLGAGVGARVVVNPVEGLYIAGSLTDAYAESYDKNDSEVKDGDAAAGDLKFDENLVGFSAKYSTDAFFVTAGANFAKVFYGSVGFTGVENLTLAFEVFSDVRDYDTSAEEDTNNNTLLVPFVEYTGIDKLDLAAFAYIYVADDAYFQGKEYPTFVEFVPAVSFELTDIVKLQAEADIYIPQSWDEDKYGEKADSYAVIVPSVAFLAGKNAEVDIYAAISTDTDYQQHTIGAGVKYNF